MELELHGVRGHRLGASTPDCCLLPWCKVLPFHSRYEGVATLATLSNLSLQLLRYLTSHSITCLSLPLIISNLSLQHLLGSCLLPRLFLQYTHTLICISIIRTHMQFDKEGGGQGGGQKAAERERVRERDQAGHYEHPSTINQLQVPCRKAGTATRQAQRHGRQCDTAGLVCRVCTVCLVSVPCVCAEQTGKPEQTCTIPYSLIHNDKEQ